MASSQGLTPTIDHVRPGTYQLTFDKYHYEYVLPLPDCDAASLLDVAITIQLGHASTITSGGRMASVCPNDLHLYFAGERPNKRFHVDITDLLLEQLRNELNSRDQSQVISEYEEAIGFWFEVAKELMKYGGEYNAESLKKEQDTAQMLLSKTPVSSNLSQLGDTSVGVSGRLHLSNFLYGFVSLGAASLAKLIAEYNLKTTDPIQLPSIRHPKLVVSHGPCRFYSGTG